MELIKEMPQTRRRVLFFCLLLGCVSPFLADGFNLLSAGHEIKDLQEIIHPVHLQKLLQQHDQSGDREMILQHESGECQRLPGGWTSAIHDGGRVMFVCQSLPVSGLWRLRVIRSGPEVFSEERVLLKVTADQSGTSSSLPLHWRMTLLERKLLNCPILL